MLKAILYKELLKIRWLWLTLLAANALLMAYIFIETRQAFTLDHAEIVWYRVMHLDRIHYGRLMYAPLLTGLLVGCIQYLPEMTGERLRLSLHLPVSPHRLVMAHVLTGLAAVASAVVLDLAALAALNARFFPAEAVRASLVTALPWGLAGLSAYLGVTLCLLEPGYKRKVFNLAVAAAITALFLQDADQNAYLPALAVAWIPVALMIPAVLLPAYHFRFRRVC
jgi:hypothetical protein